MIKDELVLVVVFSFVIELGWILLSNCLTLHTNVIVVEVLVVGAACIVMPEGQLEEGSLSRGIDRQMGHMRGELALRRQLI